MKNIRSFSDAVCKPLELTLAIFKPDVCRNPIHCKAIRQIILNENFYYVRSSITRLAEEDSEKFYSDHKGKFFFSRLVSFMSSGPISVHILARENAINHWRKLMGPTKVYVARHEAPNSIRAQFGLTDTRNATHGADSPDSVKREMTLFFPEFDVNEWYKEEEIHFRNAQNIEFIADQSLHKIKNYDELIATN